MTSNSRGTTSSNVVTATTGRSSASQSTPAIKCGDTRMSNADRESHLKGGLCFICHQPGHIARDCMNDKSITAATPPKTARLQTLEEDSGDDDYEKAEQSEN